MLNAQSGEKSVPQTKCADDNVCNVYRDARAILAVRAARSRFRAAPRQCSLQECRGTFGSHVADVARAVLRLLNRYRRRSLDLFEVAVVLNACSVEREEEVQVAKGAGDVAENCDVAMLKAFIKFSTSVLTAAVASTIGQTPSLSGVCKGIRDPEICQVKILEECVTAYDEVRVCELYASM